MMKPNFFSDNSPFLNHPLLTAERTQQEVDFLLAQLDLPPEARLLDMGCGFGRHSIEFARRGFAVTAVDPSSAMIGAAEKQARLAGVSIAFYCLGGQAFSIQLFGERPFQAAICLFTTLGQIGEEGDNVGLIQCVYEALEPGGHFVIEVPQRETAVRHLKASDQFGETAVTRQFDPDSNIFTEKFAVGQATEFLLQYRLFSREELMQLVELAGFELTAVFGDYTGATLTPESSTMLFICQRP